LAVRALRPQPAAAVGHVIVSWLRSAYAWQTRDGSVKPPYWILKREEQTLLLRAMKGDRRATWHDIDELLAVGARHNVDAMAIAAPAGVPETEELLGTQWEDVRAWGPSERERIYVEIEHELGGVGF